MNFKINKLIIEGIKMKMKLYTKQKKLKNADVFIQLSAKFENGRFAENKLYKLKEFFKINAEINLNIIKFLFSKKYRIEFIERLINIIINHRINDLRIDNQKRIFK